MLGSSARSALLLLFNRIWLSGEWPDEWRMGSVLPLFKGGSGASRSDANDYRPITLTNSISKLFESLMLGRLTSWSNEMRILAEEQGGFRSGRSTMDQIFTLHEILSHRHEHRKKTYLAFLDARRAYDRVWRDGLLHRLIEYGVDGRMLQMLASMLRSNTRTVLVQGMQSEAFETTVGLPQGAVLSPLLYALFINPLVAKLKEAGLGVDVCNCRVPVLLYADDIVLIADNPAELQQMLDATSEFASEQQFRFNTKQGKSDVVISPQPSAEDAGIVFKLGDGPLHLSPEYKYLGVEMGLLGHNRSAGWDSYIQRVERKATMSMQQLAYSVSGRSPLHVSTAIQLFKTLVRPVLEYAIGIWGQLCTEQSKKLLERVQVQFGRRLLHLQRCIPGTYVRRELGLQSLEERAVAATLNFFGKLCTMDRSRLASKLFRYRARIVDESDHGRYSWCYEAKRALERCGLGARWYAREVDPESWGLTAKRAVRSVFRDRDDERTRQRPQLALFHRLGPCSQGKWLDRPLNHSGAALRFRLMCGGAPLMETVGAGVPHV